MRLNPLDPTAKPCKQAIISMFRGNLLSTQKRANSSNADIAVQTRQVMENIKAILTAANYSLKDIVQTTVYLSSMTHFEGFNREYAKYFDCRLPSTRHSSLRIKNRCTPRSFSSSLQRVAAYASISYKYLANAKYQQGITMAASLKKYMQQLSGKKAPGPSMSFTIFHVFYALQLMAQKPIGRNKLAEQLNVGDGAIRTIISRLTGGWFD